MVACTCAYTRGEQVQSGRGDYEANRGESGRGGRQNKSMAQPALHGSDYTNGSNDKMARTRARKERGGIATASEKALGR